MATQLDGNERRRMILRRGRGAGGGGSSFGGGGTGRVESLRDTAAEADEVDDAIDPDQIEQRARGRIALPPPVTPDDARDNPRSRLDQVSMAGSPAFAKEYRLSLVHRLLMRGTPLDQIARSLQVSVSTIERDRAELKKMLREQARSLNIEEIVGGQNAFYDEVQAMALRVASAGADANGQGGAPVAMKLAAMRTALAANADRTRFLNTAGVFDVLRFKRPEEGDALSEVQTLMEQTRAMFDQLANQPEEGAEQPRPRRAVRRTRPGGFAPMSFDDADASSSSNETQEL